MKNKYFQTVFNTSIITVLLILILHILNFSIIQILQKENSLSFLNLNDFYVTISYQIQNINLILTITFFILIGIEVVIRFLNDSIINLLKSIKQTMFLRHFMHQYNFSNKQQNIEITSSLQNNSVIKQFNKAIRNCYVNVWNDKVTVIIKIPRTQQAQQILKNIDSDIKEEISNNNPDYYFSQASRFKNKLIYIGSRR